MGGPKPQINAMTSSKIFERGFFVGQKYPRMEDQKPWPGLVRNQDFAQGKGLKTSAKNYKCLN